MNPIVIPQVGWNAWNSSEKDRKLYNLAIQNFKKYIISSVGLDNIDDFDIFFRLDETENYVILYYNEYRGDLIRKFRKGKPSILNTDEVIEISDYVFLKKQKLAKEKKNELIYNKGEKLIRKLLEKYDYEKANETGYKLDFGSYAEDGSNCIEILYSPINEKEKDEDEYEDINRYNEAVKMVIYMDGSFSTPEFDIQELTVDYRSTLEEIVEISEKCIFWQIDITTFAEELKKEIPPKFFELAK